MKSIIQKDKHEETDVYYKKVFSDRFKIIPFYSKFEILSKDSTIKGEMLSELDVVSSSI